MTPQATVSVRQAQKGVDHAEADELEFTGELFWAVGNRFAVAVESPLIARNSVDAPTTTGIGDTEFGFRLVAFNGETAILTRCRHF